MTINIKEQPMSDTLQEREWCDDCHGYTHMPYCPSSESAKEVNNYPPSLIDAAKGIETWWLEQGKHAFSGAPAAIFDLRAAIEGYAKHQPAARGGGDGPERIWLLPCAGLRVGVVDTEPRGGDIEYVRADQHQSLVAEREQLRKVVHAAVHVVRSYQYGNSSPDLANEFVASAAKILNDTMPDSEQRSTSE